MRKVLAILLMLLVCSVYILSIRSDQTALPNEKKLPLETVKETIVEDYPKTPREVIQLHGEIMMYQYSQEMDEVYLNHTVELLRMLYTDELKNLNEKAFQIERLKQELTNNTLQGLYLESYTIETIEFTHEYIAEIRVKYITTQNEILLTYAVIKKDNQWKIHNWWI